MSSIDRAAAGRRAVRKGPRDWSTPRMQRLDAGEAELAPGSGPDESIIS